MTYSDQPLVITIYCYYNNITGKWIILTRTENQFSLREGEVSLKIIFTYLEILQDQKEEINLSGIDKYIANLIMTQIYQ